MTIVIEISNELHAKLAAKAQSAGTNVITYIQQVLTTEARALDKIRGSLKGTGVPKELMDDRKREREL